MSEQSKIVSLANKIEGRVERALEDVLLSLGVLTSPAAVDLVVRTHHGCDVCLDGPKVRMEVDFVHRSVVPADRNED